MQVKDAMAYEPERSTLPYGGEMSRDRAYNSEVALSALFAVSQSTSMVRTTSR